MTRIDSDLIGGATAAEQVVKLHHQADDNNLSSVRRKVLRVSVRKLKAIDDPETFLRRSVLVNNTMKRLQIEVRKERGLKRRWKQFRKENHHHHHHEAVNNKRRKLCSCDELIVDSCDCCDKIDREDDEESSSSTSSGDSSNSSASSNSSSASSAHSSSYEAEDEEDELRSASTLARKRTTSTVTASTMEDVDEAIFPPHPPKLITSIDDDDDEDRRNNSDDLWKELSSDRSECWKSNPWMEPSPSPSQSSAVASQAATCGQTSMFGELQSVVFNSLIASLES